MSHFAGSPPEASELDALLDLIHDQGFTDEAAVSAFSACFHDVPESFHKMLTFQIPVFLKGLPTVEDEGDALCEFVDDLAMELEFHLLPHLDTALAAMKQMAEHLRVP